MQRIDVAERRRRLAARQRLAPRQRDAAGPPDPADVAGVARSVVALHATDPATVYLSLRCRTATPATPQGIGHSIYERRDLVRMLGMRRTMFVVPAESVPVVQASTTDKIAKDQRRLLLKLLSQAEGVADPESWLADIERSVLSVLADRGGSATATELSGAEPRLRTRIVMAAGKAYQAEVTVTSRVLFVLAAQGRIVRGRPIGSWLSQQYRWSLAEHWLSADGLPGGARQSWGGQSVGEAAAQAELARQWLAAFGPAPLADLKWWTGWTMAQVKSAVAAIGATEVDLDGQSAVALPGDLDVTPDPGDWIALLPALDPTVMGWRERSWFLAPHGPALFDVNGNAGPTVWLNGRVVGGWAQRRDGEIAVRLLEDVWADARAMIDEEASRLRDWLGEVRVIPRFRTPTERELSG